ncbi:MAG: hypothetical protein EOP00_18690, partial [Pedobacter sp.]
MSTNNRRVFLKMSAKLATSFVLFNPFKNLIRQVEPIFPCWESLIDYARWCPNVHNLQPHKIKIISETEADLYYDSERLLPIGDPDCVFVTVAMGIFIEHLSIAASAYDVKVELIKVYDPISIQSIGYTCFAKLKMLSAFQSEELSPSLILERRTSRGHYNCHSLDANLLTKIRNEAQKYGHDFFHSNDKKVIDFIVKLNQQTLFDDLSSPSNRKELDHLFRYNEQEASMKKDGLWARCMGFPGLLMKSVFRNPEAWETGVKKVMLANYYKDSFKG